MSTQYIWTVRGANCCHACCQQAVKHKQKNRTVTPYTLCAQSIFKSSGNPPLVPKLHTTIKHTTWAITTTATTTQEDKESYIPTSHRCRSRMLKVLCVRCCGTPNRTDKDQMHRILRPAFYLYINANKRTVRSHKITLQSADESSVTTHQSTRCRHPRHGGADRRRHPDGHKLPQSR